MFTHSLEVTTYFLGLSIVCSCHRMTEVEGTIQMALTNLRKPRVRRMDALSRGTWLNVIGVLLLVPL